MTCRRWNQSFLKTEPRVWVAVLLTFSCTRQVRKCELRYICFDLWWGLWKLLKHQAVHYNPFELKNLGRSLNSDLVSVLWGLNTVRKSVVQYEHASRYVPIYTYMFVCLFCPGFLHRRFMWKYHTYALCDFTKSVDTSLLRSLPTALFSNF